jgi:Ca-activated chloride channel family protein
MRRVIHSTSWVCVVAMVPALAALPGCSKAMRDSAAPAAEQAAAGGRSPRVERFDAEEKRSADMPSPIAAPPASVAAAPKPTEPSPRPAAPPPPPAQAQGATIAEPAAEPVGTEQYKDYGVNPVTDPRRDRFSTFAVDVDTASYSIARRKLREGTMPTYAAVRAEEFVNSFSYRYAPPSRGVFAVHTEAAPSPFARGHHLVRVALQTKRMTAEERRPVHLVYLVDVSGSMMAPDRIELAKKSLKMLTQTLKPGDTVALCTYAGAVREVLPPTGIAQVGRILSAIDSLTAGGSTAMSSGIQLAYDLASRTRVPGHVNHVVVLSDGDANVGNTSHQDILKTIERYRDQGITLSTVGFGSGNYKDEMMEQLADKGDGNYTYIDSESQARRVFTEQVDGLLQTVARDVKIQVEFNPNAVKTYRLIGYENRDVADKDFRNDKVDGGEVGAGHSVTALYDVVFAKQDASPLTVRIRYKAPTGNAPATEEATVMPVAAIVPTFESASPDFRFAASVGTFAEVLRKSPHARDVPLPLIASFAEAAVDGFAERRELVELVRRADRLAKGESVASMAR